MPLDAIFVQRQRQLNNFYACLHIGKCIELMEHFSEQTICTVVLISMGILGQCIDIKR